jgi:DNA-binding Lrp family transcriptional regulator
MPPDELRALGEDIKKNGLTSSIAITGDNQLLDGRNRLDAMEMIGIEFKFARGAAGSSIRIEVGTDGLYWPEIVDSDPYAYVISVNIRRRHLSIEDKNRIIVELLKADPTKSNRQVAKLTDTSHPHVAKVREQAEKAGDVETVSTSVDTTGRKQPARKPKPTEADLEAWAAGDISMTEAARRGIAEAKQLLAKKAATKPVRARVPTHVCWHCGQRGKVGEVQEHRYAQYQDVDIWLHDACVSAFDQAEQQREQQREAAAERIHALMDGKTELPDDIGPASNGEVDRLRARVEELENEKRRLEIENLALRSEVEELRARLAPAPPDDGLDIPAYLDRTRAAG